MHVVAVMVVSGAGAATAAAVVEFALAASSFVSLGTQLLEDFSICPNFVERRIMHVARLFHHVGARAHLADGAYDAVVEAGEAAAAIASLNIELVGDTQELRSARGLHGDAERTALFHNFAEQALVFGNAKRMAFDFLAATHRNQEENLVVHRADFLDPVHDVKNFVLVPVHDGRVNLEREASSLAILDTRHRKFEGVREATEIVMASRIDAIVNLAFKLAGASSNPVNVGLKVKPYISINGQQLAYPDFISMNKVLN